MNRRRRWLGKAALFCLAGLTGAATASAQTQTGTTTTWGLGLGYMPQFSTGSASSMTGQSGFTMTPMLMPMPMTTTGTAGTAAARAADPLGLGYVYGPAAIPMTPGQAGLLMLSTASRMTGIGNGQLSGVRPGMQQDSQANRRGRGKAEGLVTAAHTRNSNIPGGQAARYFNRGVTPSSSRSQPYYRRNLRYFPQTGR
ncbi:MAG: hypothetical protein ACP5XB_10670 [Isosphaeraceae bacterium]